MRQITPADVAYAKRVVLALPVSYALGTDDAIGEGLVGLWKAARSYDGRGHFLGYANRRIVGEVLDAARRADHLQRKHRQDVKAGECEDALAPVRLEDLVGVGSYWSWESMLGSEDDDIALRITLDEAICSIEGNAGAALRLWLLHDVPQAQIGEALGLSESRISQMISAARGELREALGASSVAELLG